MSVLAQDAAGAIARLTGVSDVAELDEGEYEHWAYLLAHPVPINALSEGRLAATGLFSPFQLASLKDYRARCGDILSFLELAQLDGFNDDNVAALRPFITLEGGRITRPETAFHGEWISQVSGSATGETTAEGARWASSGLGAKTKARISVGEWMGAAYSPSGTYYLALNGVRHPWRLVVGDYRVRTGQGLALWKGFSISGLTSLSAFAKTSPGLSPTASWSEGTAFRGVAGEYRMGRWKALAFVSGGFEADPLLTGCQLLRLFRNGQVGLLAYRQEKTPAQGRKAAKDGEVKLAADAFWAFRKWELFGECAWDALPGAGAALAGLRMPLGEKMRLAAAGRYYGGAYGAMHAGALRAGTRCSDEIGFSLGWEYGSEKRVKREGAEGFGSSVQQNKLLLTMDAAAVPSTPGKGQLKVFAQYDAQLSGTWGLQMRLTHRRRWRWTPENRSEGRLDLIWQRGPLRHVTRLDLLRGEGLSGLLYDEWGYGDSGPFRVYLRGTLFAADHWNDRIYAYERDAPGAFSVPAFYGRGWKLMLLAGWKTKLPHHRLRAAFYLRGALTGYPAAWALPGTDPKKPKVQATAQLSLTF